MNLTPNQIQGKAKEVGILNGKKVLELTTKGGLTLVVAPMTKGFETLGAGPHKAVARHIALKNQPDIKWTELSKADYIDPKYFQHLLPEYESLVSALRTRQGF